MWRIAYSKKALKLSAGIASFFGVLIAFIPFGNLWWLGAVIVTALALISFLAEYLRLRLSSHRLLAKHGKNKIYVEYGDVLALKTEPGANKPVVLIGVNSAFDYLVDNSLNVSNPVIAETTLHGKWIEKLTQNEPHLLANIQSEIDAAINTAGLEPIRVLKKKRGNQNTYPLGSFIFLERDEVGYLLYAFTEFNARNNIIEQVTSKYHYLIGDALVEAINRCQGRDVYIPLLGAGLSGYSNSKRDAFRAITEALITRRSSLRSSVHVVVYTGDRDEVSIHEKTGCFID